MSVSDNESERFRASGWHAPEIDGKLFINDFGDREELDPGRFYRCEITEAHEYDLVAKIVD